MAETARHTPLPKKVVSSRFILLVEDDVDIQDAMREILTDEGFAVETANNGSEALVKLRAASTLPALILLDLMMPVMDGHTFRERQLHDEDLRDIPVVIVSAERNAQARSVAMRATAFLAKPVNLDDLLNTLDSLTRRE